MKRFRNLLVCAALSVISSTALAQVKVTGTITDAQGEPIIGATVKEKGSSMGTVTDLDGHFKMEVKSSKSTLTFSYIGFLSQDVAVGNNHTFNIVLQEDSKQLEDVVVVGYGTQKKATVTGAVSSISGEVLESRPVSNTAVGLQGRIPGLSITRTSARPGSEGLSISIRGASSVNSVEPLIIIDGVPVVSNTEFNQLNPNDIENISVLKDASAAIYGSRAAGGVILVTTKKGKKGDKIKVTYNGMVTANTPANMIPLAGMKEWASAMVDASYQDYVEYDAAYPHGEKCTQRYVNGQIWNNVLTNDDGSSILKSNVSSNSFSEDPMRVIDKMALGEGFDYMDSSGQLHHYESNNWIDLLYGTTWSTQHNLGISGASERARWNASLGYSHDKSVIIAAYDGSRKYNARLNVDFDLTNWLTLNTNMSYMNNYTKTPLDGLDGNNSGVYDAPCAPAYTPSGDFYDFYVCGRSPISAMQGGGQYTREYDVFRYANTLTAHLTKDLTLTGVMSFVKFNNIQSEHKTHYYVGWWDGSKRTEINGGKSQYAQERTQRNFYQNYQIQADYKHTFANVHNIALMVGANAEKNSYKNVTAKRDYLLYDGLYDLNTASSESQYQHISGGSNANGYVSFVGRLNYNYAEKYLFELLGRRDGTSKFHPDYRWSNFGAVSGGWRISEEKFIRDNVKWLNNLKIRAEYGVTGGAVSSLGNYDYLSSMSTTGTYYFNTGLVGTAYLSSMTDYSRTWEKLHSFNIGVDFALFGNRLTGSFDWYQKRNVGMLASLQYPDVLGSTPAATNSTKLRVRGWEVQVNWQDHIGEVNYWVGASLMDARSMVTDYEGTDTWTAGVVKVREGYPLNSIFVYKTDGYFSSYEEIDAYYKQYANCTSALSKVAQTSSNTHLRPGDRKKILILDPENDTTNGKGNTGSGDVYHYGDTDPHFSFGFNAGASWNGFDFQVFIQGVGQRYMMRDGLNLCAFYRNYTNILTSHLDTWTWDNQDAEYARLSLYNDKNNWNVNNNDASVLNAWYARLKNITVGYTLPKSLTTPLKIDKVRVYFSGDNVAEITGLTDGFDPEKGTSARTSLPFSRSWTLGLDVTF